MHFSLRSPRLAWLFLGAALLPALASPAAAQNTDVPPFQSVSAMKAYIDRQMSNDVETDYLEGYLYYLEQRAYPNDSIDWSYYNRAVANVQRLPAARLGGSAAAVGARRANAVPDSTARWESIGPHNLPVPYQKYYGVGNVAGRVNGVAYSPADTLTRYAATAGGGVWKTVNGGSHWTNLSRDWAFQETSSVAVDPRNSDTIYVGTGDYDGGHGLSFGMMKSTNGGVTWTNTGNAQFGGTAVKAIVIDPDNPSIITIATGHSRDYYGYLWRSTDAGTTWTKVYNSASAESWRGLKLGAANASGVRHLYAVAQGGGGVAISDDRGATWTKVTSPLTNNEDSVDIAPSPINSETVYLFSGSQRKLWKSTNAGGQWIDITAAFPAGVNFSQEFYDLHLECSSHTASGGAVTDVLYAGLIDIFQSPDGGASWRSVGGPTDSGNAQTHNDQHALAINPTNPDEVTLGNDGGVYQITTAADITAIPPVVNLNADLLITQFYHMDASTTDPTYLIAGAQDNATAAALGDLDNWKNIGAGDGNGCAINPLNQNNQYSSYQYSGIETTNNAWRSKFGISPDVGNDRAPFVTPLTLDQNSPNLLYTGTNYLYRRDNVTGQWTPRLGNQALSGGSVIHCIVVAPSDSRRIYTGSDDGQVWMTTDAGATWARLDGAGLPNRSVTSISVSPTQPNQILVGLSGTGTSHLWRCPDTGAGNARVWNNISGTPGSALPDIPLNSVVRDYNEPENVFFAGTDVGVFYTADAGRTWSNATAPLGLPNVQVIELKVVPGTGSLYAATYGRGIWRLPIAPTVHPYAHVLWTQPGGATEISTITVTSTVVPNSYGPFPGWQAKALADGPDGAAHALWANADGRLALWTLSDNSPRVDVSIYGPYPHWTPQTLAVGPNGNTRVLWTSTYGQMSLWNVDAQGDFTYKTYGPFPGWTAKQVAVDTSNTVRVLWTDTNGQVSLWTGETPSPAHAEYGPYPGWTVKGLSAAANGNLRLLWNNTSTEASLWDLNSAGQYTYRNFGPYPGQTADGVAVGTDGLTRLIWNTSTPDLRLWSLDYANPNIAPTITPFASPGTGFTARSVTSGP